MRMNKISDLPIFLSVNLYSGAARFGFSGNLCGVTAMLGSELVKKIRSKLVGEFLSGFFVCLRNQNFVLFKL